jgi:4-carboxymuconolactone decarboxylase
MRHTRPAGFLTSLLLLSFAAAQAQAPPGPPQGRENESVARERATVQGLRRMAPIPPEQWTAEQKHAVEIYEAERKNPPKSGIFMDLLRVPEIMEPAFRMRVYVQKKISFGDKLSSLAMLVTLREWNERQEFGGHAGEAVRDGLDPRIVQAIAEGYRPPNMSEDETLIYDFSTELLRNHNVSDPTYAHMVKRFGERGVIEEIGLLTLYSMVGMTYNTVREPVPVGYPPLPDFPQTQSVPVSTYADIPPAPPNSPALRPAAPPPH